MEPLSIFLGASLRFPHPFSNKFTLEDGQTSSGDGGLEEDAIGKNAADNGQDGQTSSGDGGLEEDAIGKNAADNGQDGQTY